MNGSFRMIADLNTRTPVVTGGHIRVRCVMSSRKAAKEYLQNAFVCCKVELYFAVLRELLRSTSNGEKRK